MNINIEIKIHRLNISDIQINVEVHTHCNYVNVVLADLIE